MLKSLDWINLIIAALIIIYLLMLPGNAGAQPPTPTPVCTMTPDGEQCTSSIAMTTTPTTTLVVPPTVEPTITLFVPTETPTRQPTATNTPRPQPTITLIPIRVGGNAHMPIIWK